MNLTKSFPPADALIETLQSIDYQKHFHQFMNTVETICIVVAAVCIVIRNKWQQYDCTERLYLFLLWMKDKTVISYHWTRNVLIPFLRDTWSLMMETYRMISARQYVTL